MINKSAFVAVYAAEDSGHGIVVDQRPPAGTKQVAEPAAACGLQQIGRLLPDLELLHSSQIDEEDMPWSLPFSFLLPICLYWTERFIPTNSTGGHKGEGLTV